MLSGLRIPLCEKMIAKLPEQVDGIVWPLTQRQFLYPLLLQVDTNAADFVMKVQRKYPNTGNSKRMDCTLEGIGPIEKIKSIYLNPNVSITDLEDFRFFEEKYTLCVTYREPNVVTLNFSMIVGPQRILLEHAEGLDDCWIKPLVKQLMGTPEFLVPPMSLVRDVEGHYGFEAPCQSLRLPLQVREFIHINDLPMYFLQKRADNSVDELHDYFVSEINRRKQTENVVQLRRTQ